MAYYLRFKAEGNAEYQILHYIVGQGFSHKVCWKGMSMKQHAVRRRGLSRHRAQVLLDGMIIYGHELGELGKQLERLLRQRGVRSSMDPALVLRFH